MQLDNDPALEILVANSSDNWHLVDFVGAAGIGDGGQSPGVDAKRAALGLGYPNPLNPNTSIPFTLSSRAEAVLTVYDVAGRSVRELSPGTLDAGAHELVWDGRDHSGRQVASGSMGPMSPTTGSSSNKGGSGEVASGSSGPVSLTTGSNQGSSWEVAFGSIVIFGSTVIAVVTVSILFVANIFFRIHPFQKAIW